VSRVLKVFFHDACFDGTTSAALFAAFYREVIENQVEVKPIGMIHRDGNPFEGIPLDADDHACVDFRFCADPKMRWWFDHHPTAFQPPALREVFEDQHLATWFFDPTSPSCAGLIGRCLTAGWDWKPPAYLTDAIEWADKIDAAVRERRGRSARDAGAGSRRGPRTAGRGSTPHYVSGFASALAMSPRGLSSHRSSQRSEEGARIDGVRRLGVCTAT
jgi:hypothetical protein